MITPSNYRWTTEDPPGVLEQQYLLWYMLYNKAAHIEDELYDIFKIWASEQYVKFFNANGCILKFVIKWMTTISMIIAQGATKEVTLLLAFRKYTNIFSEKTPTNLSPSQSYNYAIELKDSFISKQFKTCPLNSDEQQACKEFIEKHLKTGKISPSKFFQAFLFFFIKKKKAVKLHSCQDYHYLNSHMIRNTYFLPLISDLINKL